jgi:hypothetical protein
MHTLLLVAHWLELWRASLAATVLLLACPFQRQLLEGKPIHADATHHIFVHYMLMYNSVIGPEHVP